MPITLGNTTITGLGVGGLPAGTVNATTLAAGAARANFGAGAILQWQQAVKTDTFSTTTGSGSFVDVPDLSVNITPASASNRILVLSAISFGVDASLHYAAIRILRSGTAIALANADGSRTTASLGSQSDDDNTNHGAIIWVDNPATTSTLTYKIQITGETGRTKYINRGREGDGDNVITQRVVSSIVLLEIAG